MNLKTFEKSFSKTILDRGKGYYKNGYVISLEETDTNEWFAEVDGTEVYEVEVSLNSYQDIISSHCDCPYGSACKHEVAVYLEMRKQLGSAKSTRKKVSPKVSKKEEVLTILKNAKTEDLHTFIANYASKNKEFKFEIMNRFGQLDSDPDEIRRHYQKLVKSVIYLHADRGWLDYSAGRKLSKKLDEFCGKAIDYIAKNQFDIALAILQAVISEAKKIAYTNDESHDTAGSVDEAVQIINDMVEEILDEVFRNHILDYAIAESADPVFTDYGADVSWYEIMFKLADNLGRENKFLKIIDQRLQKHKGKAGFSSKYEIEKLSRWRLEVMENSKNTHDSDEFIQQNLHIKSFRDQQIKEAIARKDYEKGIELAKGGIRQDEKKSPGYVQDWQEHLMQIYLLQGNKKAIVDLARTRFENDFRGSKMTLFKIIRDNIPEAEWEIELGIIVRKIKKEGEFRKEWGGKMIPNENLCNIYIEEKMWEELDKLMEKSNSITSIETYLQYLPKEKYTEKLIELYILYIRNKAKQQGRPVYEEIAKLILKVFKFGGEQEAITLQKELLQAYPKRRAMQEELKKVRLS
jgi:hypothetical protein